MRRASRLSSDGDVPPRPGSPPSARLVTRAGDQGSVTRAGDQGARSGVLCWDHRSAGFPVTLSQRVSVYFGDGVQRNGVIQLDVARRIVLVELNVGRGSQVGSRVRGCWDSDDERADDLT